VRGVVARVVVCGVVLVVCCVMLFVSCVCVCDLFLFLQEQTLSEGGGVPRVVVCGVVLVVCVCVWPVSL